MKKFGFIAAFFASSALIFLIQPCGAEELHEASPQVDAVWAISDDFSEVVLSVTNKTDRPMKLWEELGRFYKDRGFSGWVTPADPIKGIIAPIVAMYDLKGRSINFKLGWKGRDPQPVTIEAGQTVKIDLRLPTGLSEAVKDAHRASFSLLYDNRGLAFANFFRLDKWKYWK